VVVWALIGSGGLSTMTARADDATDAPGVSVELVCPALSEDARSEVDARVRADLAARAEAGGVLTLECDSSQATLTWQPVGKNARAATVVLAGSAAALPDRLLEAFADLLAQPDEPAEVPAPEPTKPAPPPKPPPKVEPRAAPAPRPIAEPRRPLLWLAAGLNAEWWSPFPAALIGGHAGVVLAPSRRFALTSTLGYGFGAGMPEELSASAVSGRMTADLAIDAQRRIELGVGASASRISVDAAGELAPDTQATLAVAGLVRARYAARFGTWDLLVGPELQGRLGAVDVEIDGARALRLPELTIGLAVDAAWCLCSIER
jgi:hypothetical protein